MNTLQNTNKPTVLLFSEPGGFALTLVEQLLVSMCNVVVVTKVLDEWVKSTDYIKEKDNLRILDIAHVKNTNLVPNYIIFLSNSLEGSEKTTPDNIETIVSLQEIARSYQASVLFILPFSKHSDIEMSFVGYIMQVMTNLRDLSSMIFLGDIFATRINLSENRVINRILKDITRASPIRFPFNEFALYPTSAKVAAQAVIRKLFSFGGMGDRVAILPPQVSSREFVEIIKEIKQGVEINFVNEEVVTNRFSDIARIESLEQDLKDELREIFNWYSPLEVFSQNLNTPTPEVFVEPTPTQNIQPIFNPFAENIYNYVASNTVLSQTTQKASASKLKTPDISKVTKKARKNVSKFFKTNPIGVQIYKYKYHTTTAVVFLLTLPYLLLLLGGVGLIHAKNQITNGNIDRAQTFTNISDKMFKVSEGELKVLVKAPILGRVFQGSLDTAKLAIQATELASEVFINIRSTEEVFQSVLTGKSIDIAKKSTEISLNLEDIYRDMSFLEAELSGKTGVIAYFRDKVVGKTALKDVREKLFYAQLLVKDLPDLLGSNEKKVYLVLLQNNMELRATGGFIGSFALVSIDRGRLTDITVQDVYDADGQLKGHVEPPSPIKNYLGEASWYLRDSNWDPDFAVSAERAEWFIDKEIDVQVDGVIGIDLEVAKSLVDVFGSIKLADFNKEITSANLYEITQSEVEEDFFPGSRKKSTFLTSLTRELLQKVTKLEKEEYVGVSKALYNGLENKHIQLQFHGASSQKSVAGLGWDGTLTKPACSGNCYTDIVAPVESNVGVNKANYFINRQMSLDVDVSDGLIKRKLSINLTNTAPEFYGEAIKYKSYVRVFAPQDAIFSTVEMRVDGKTTRLTPEVVSTRGFKEGGVLVELMPQKQAVITFSWVSNTSVKTGQSGNYDLVFRKQAGTVSDALGVSLRANTLTKGAPSSYNTTLARDFETKLEW